MDSGKQAAIARQLRQPCREPVALFVVRRRSARISRMESLRVARIGRLRRLRQIAREAPAGVL